MYDVEQTYSINRSSHALTLQHMARPDGANKLSWPLTARRALGVAFGSTLQSCLFHSRFLEIAQTKMRGAESTFISSYTNRWLQRSWQKETRRDARTLQWKGGGGQRFGRAEAFHHDEDPVRAWHNGFWGLSGQRQGASEATTASRSTTLILHQLRTGQGTDSECEWQPRTGWLAPGHPRAW